MTHSASPGIRALGEKVFTEEDQLDFAAASRDRNPMHVDALAARRLLSGRQVVHGIHTLIHAIELWAQDQAAGRLRLTCSFAHPVNVGDHVVFSRTDEDGERVRIVAAVDGLACTELLIEPAPDPEPGGGSASAMHDPGRPVRHVGELSAALDEPAGSQIGGLIEIQPWRDSLADRFPQAARLLGSEALSAVARLSYFVGMVCPGLHSVFSSLHFSTGGSATATALRFEVRKFDPRFRLFTIAFDGPLRGDLRAFLRPPPQLQARASEVARQFEGHEFKGSRSLVIGGSRGLGETTAKLIAAGGGDVVVSYAVGRAEAEAVAADINANGRGRCDVVHLDLRSEFQGMAGVDPANLDAVYFFATPRIYAKRNELFDRDAFNEFVDFYLQRFYQLCRWLDRTERAKPLKVYLPSTIFIAERPKGLTEYAMAKAAAEVLADDINRSLLNVRVLHSRLPRLATDQTASILPVSVASNLDAMLVVVRDMAA